MMLKMSDDPECRKIIFVYIVGIVLLFLGGLYPLWRINILSQFLIDYRHYIMSRDLRWEEHIKNQAAMTKEILRRLPRDNPETTAP